MAGHVDDDVATRVVLRPLATPLPLGFLALAMATTVFAAVQLEWVDPAEGRVAALTALTVTFPLQFLACVIGFLARDAVAATGMGLLAGTWAAVGAVTWTADPGARSDGLGIVLIAAGVGMVIPAAAAAGSKLVAAAVMAVAGTRFVVTGIYESTGNVHWQNAAGWTGIALAAVAFYAAAALEMEATSSRALLPVGRRGSGSSGATDESVMRPADLAVEAGVRPRL